MSLLPELLEILQPKQVEEDTFIGQNLNIGSLAVYGGQVLAQAIAVAGKSVPTTHGINSLHAYFLLWGDNDKEITFKVQNIRDGKSFCTCRVNAIQNGKIIFILAAQFHRKEDGLNHQVSMPNVARPESLTSFSDLFEELSAKLNIKPKGIYAKNSPIIFHPVEHENPFKPGIKPPLRHVWFKSNGALPNDQRIQESYLAYVSDFSLITTALLPHNVSLFSQPMKLASLDHAMWFHREINANDWMLYVIESPNASGSRGYCTGRMFDIHGNLVASVAQEGLIRLIDSKK